MNILLAVDNSPHSKVAVDVLLNRIWPDGSTFKVFCAVERREPVFAVMARQEADEFHKKALAAAEQFTAEIAERLQAQFPRCKAVHEATFGDSKELILKQVDSPTDLIVVGSQGRHGLPRIFLGSVSQTVLLYAPCSTLIARYQHAHEGVPKFDKHVLLAVDNTPHSHAAIDWVLKMPWSDDTKFTLLCVLPGVTDKYSDGIDALYTNKFSAERVEVQRTTNEFLTEKARLLDAKLGAGKTKIEIREGDPSDEILSAARTWPAGLVVMGSRSRGHVTRLFMGSVSQEVVLQAPCPVEIIKSIG